MTMEDGMFHSEPHLRALGQPAGDAYDLPASAGRFGDGGQHRLEIPSVEGPAAMRRVLEAARARGLRVHRVSQGSGIWMLTDDELAEMVDLGAAEGVEVCLFVGPRAAWDTGTQAASSGGRVVAGALRGADGIAHGTDDVLRGCALGLRSVLVADLGLLSVLGQLKRAGVLPADLQLKVSASLPVANPATAAVLAGLGATSLNLVVDLSIPAIAAIRRSVDLPLDVYVEAPEDFGGGMRHYDIPRLVDVAAPVYLKFAVRNAPGTYPSGGHLQELVERLGEERVRRAALGLALLDRYRPQATASATAAGVPVAPGRGGAEPARDGAGAQAVSVP